MNVTSERPESSVVEGPRTHPQLVFTAPRRGKPPVHWADLGVQERKEAVAALGLPTFRAQQLSRHWFVHSTADPADWTDIPAGRRQEIADALFPPLLEEVRSLTADAGTTVKTLWKLHDGSMVESVLMHYPASGGSAARTTVCVSSQAGCGMACPFCATGQGGLQRNLSAAEIVAQIVDANARLAAGTVPGATGRVNNIVFMGMGEPLANYATVIRAIRTLLADQPDGLGMSARGITVSTVGLVPGIDKLAAEGLPITLALSLHAPDDELRDDLVPINNRWKVDEAVDAAWRYAKATKRRVSIEYALIRDINDQADRADRLARLLRKRGDWGWFHVNLIPLNPTPGSKWTASRRQDEHEFVRRLEAHGVPVTIRDTRGREIDGACGQLAATAR
ncbi:23S rRNA (adenine(2503)-C(2))-methyltransferase RlmN [Raineyella fluvialis]|uniref:Probable dual-specificity RNA methyltransferase RlmN n=1 Tax=Raineyella fluvialis TaxID=2662261 RepID=A0A5Q2FJV9_9ACTN|nr:23S rRNA (adenine(2503)-C(2))-methyltransferase RlmN [Raineyella fluvialis]